jgi:imidazolonepropionase-like amidohydrolase
MGSRLPTILANDRPEQCLVAYDAHWHMFMAAVSPAILVTADPRYLNLVAARQAEATLMRSFTTIRDMGGPVFGLKRAIDEGVTVGPRIYPSGAPQRRTHRTGSRCQDFRVPLPS